MKGRDGRRRSKGPEVDFSLTDSSDPDIPPLLGRYGRRYLLEDLPAPLENVRKLLARAKLRGRGPDDHE